MLCWFQVYSKAIQLCVYIYPFFFRFFPHIGYYKILSRVPCAIQQVMVIYFIYSSVYWRRHRHPTPVLLPGKSHGRGAWWAAVHGVGRSRTRLSKFTFTFHFHALEKEVASHSSVLAWRIPGTGEPGGLPSLGSHRVGHD